MEAGGVYDLGELLIEQKFVNVDVCVNMDAAIHYYPSPVRYR